jgi:NAD(P)-dependent dehydrogenase (short-subunit alcohol dehydrogenase family)
VKTSNPALPPTPGVIGTVVALVTGASRGLGAALVSQLSSRGAHVFAAARDTSGMACSIDSSVNRVVVDYADPNSIVAVSAEVAAKVTRLDLLINCAGVNKAADAPAEASKGLLNQLDPPALNTMFTVNVVGPTLTTARLWTLLVASSSPRVINISTDRASMQNAVGPNAFGYSVTKAALNMATWRGDDDGSQAIT